MINKMLNLIQTTLIAAVQKDINDLELQIEATYRGKKNHSQEVIGDMANKVKRLNEEKIEILSLISKLRRHIRE